MGSLTDTFTNSWADAAQSALLRPVQTWLMEHPLMGWLAGHPLWLLVLVVVGLLLFAGLWSAIARLTEGFWLSLVKLPFRLSGWIFGAVSGLLVRQWAKPAKLEAGENRLSEIMGRLETLQTEQESLLEEMKGLLGKRGER
ncbi:MULTISPECIES: hypothetical protein [Cyanophyceae]|uniref:hypothetical protein n=1 Tax=Cyanophyceae TaxID=3028117 RepID=UPI0016871194|nr:MULTISPECIES: hypothetical protein [Cyanophyceae]MBD1916009.1 hypothetical protein [Phormidium sp. FACHB-77]MBD2031722.1 hypothetical protein [Phormidium sp. FACHB-322]MBD2052651.1 hypothetical protein [Leptolyngbya sp. FACHB-60]